MLNSQVCNNPTCVTYVQPSENGETTILVPYRSARAAVALERSGVVEQSTSAWLCGWEAVARVARYRWGARLLRQRTGIFVATGPCGSWHMAFLVAQPAERPAARWSRRYRGLLWRLRVERSGLMPWNHNWTSITEGRGRRLDSFVHMYFYIWLNIDILKYRSVMTLIHLRSQAFL